jgi:hypothetical protein
MGAKEMISPGWFRGRGYLVLKREGRRGDLQSSQGLQMGQMWMEVIVVVVV